MPRKTLEFKLEATRIRGLIQDRMVQKLLENIRKTRNSWQETEMVKIKNKRDWILYVHQPI
jgi:hypothetical protein